MTGQILSEILKGIFAFLIVFAVGTPIARRLAKCDSLKSEADKLKATDKIKTKL